MRPIFIKYHAIITPSERKEKKRKEKKNELVIELFLYHRKSSVDGLFIGHITRL